MSPVGRRKSGRRAATGARATRVARKHSASRRATGTARARKRAAAATRTGPAPSRKPARSPKPGAAKKRPARSPKPGAAKPVPRAALRVVRRPAPRGRATTTMTPAFPQRAGATSRQLALFEIVRARAAVIAAVHGLTADAAERSPRGTRWSVREVILHLHAWDLEWERAIEPALRGVRAAWMDCDDAELSRLNERLLAPWRSVPWDEALRRLQAGHARLLEEVESLPDTPVALWTREHPLGAMLALIPEHDHHHADIILKSRITDSSSPRTP